MKTILQLTIALALVGSCLTASEFTLAASTTLELPASPEEAFILEKKATHTITGYKKSGSLYLQLLNVDISKDVYILPARLGVGEKTYAWHL